jgi:Leucine-rich repeat (LRR) protein
MVTTRISGNNVFIENCSDEKIKLTNCDELGNVIKSQFDLYNDKKLIFRNCPNLKKITADCLNLTDLEIESCPNLEKLSAYYNKIKEINLTGLNNLKVVNLDNGILENIYLAGCEKLSELHVSNNRLKNLDLTDNEELRILYCSYNKILQKLEVEHLKKLEILHCESCLLLSLSCKNLKKLKSLYCFDNGFGFLKLSKLDVIGCDSLEELDCAENSLEEFTLLDHPKLHTFSCKVNKLKELLIINCPDLGLLNFSDQIRFRAFDRVTQTSHLKGNTPTILLIDKFHNLEIILHTEGATLINFEDGEELSSENDFPNLKEYGLGTENDPSFET